MLDHEIQRLPIKRVQPPQLEPAYLLPSQRPDPDHELLNVVVEGADFVRVERFARWVHHTVGHCRLLTADAWAAPCTVQLVRRLRAESSDVAAEYRLQLYKRCVQLRRVPASRVAPLLHVLAAGVPGGVHLRLLRHSQEQSEERYIPDQQLRELQQEIGLIGTENYHKHKRSATVEFWLNIAYSSHRHRRKDQKESEE